MWILFWKKYQLSKFATFVSIVGALVRYGGVLCLFSALIVPALICIGIGVGIHFCAEAINKSKTKKFLAKQQKSAPVNDVSNKSVEENAQPEAESVAKTEA